MIDDLPPLREVIAHYDLRADKALGQNFLLDSNITDKIARAARDFSPAFDRATIIEIGPGPGGLTRSLLRAGAGELVAIEYDPRAVRAQEDLVAAANGRLRVIEADALRTDLSALVPQGPRRIVANLPYNIASQLLIGWLRALRADPGFVSAMILMFQREVADRLCAAPATKAYGRLSVMTQWLCVPRRLFDLPPSVFVPPPKITSSVVGFSPRALPPDSPSFSAMEEIVAAAFGQRRKMVRSSLKKYAPLLEICGIDPTARAETLGVDDFVRLAQALEAS